MIKLPSKVEKNFMLTIYKHELKKMKCFLAFFIGCYCFFEMANLPGK